MVKFRNYQYRNILISLLKSYQIYTYKFTKLVVFYSKMYKCYKTPISRNLLISSYNSNRNQKVFTPYRCRLSNSVLISLINKLLQIYNVEKGDKFK